MPFIYFIVKKRKEDVVRWNQICDGGDMMKFHCIRIRKQHN